MRAVFDLTPAWAGQSFVGKTSIPAQGVCSLLHLERLSQDPSLGQLHPLGKGRSFSLGNGDKQSTQSESRIVHSMAESQPSCSGHQVIKNKVLDFGSVTASFPNASVIYDPETEPKKQTTTKKDCFVFLLKLCPCEARAEQVTA